jgi:chloride channel protein, CIC family
VNKEQAASYWYLLRWTGIAVVAGTLGAGTLQLFRWLLSMGQDVLVATAIPLPVWTLLAALFVGGILYRISPDAAGEGVPSYLYSLTRNEARFQLRATLFKFPSALITLAAFGSGGIVGPVGRTVAGILSALAERLKGRLLSDEDRRTAAICGMAATVGALFHAPIGGGLFAVEIIQKQNMAYRDIFPAILSSALAMWFSAAMGWAPLFLVPSPAGPISVGLVASIIVFSFVIGVVGGGYTSLYTLTVRVFRRDQGRVLLKVAIGATAGAVIVWLVNPQLAGTAAPIFEAVFSGRLDAIYGSLPRALPLVIVSLVMLVTRAVTSCLTIGSGMSAGLMGPAALIGVLAAHAAAMLVGVQPGTVDYFALLAAGFSGILASVMNVPIAAAIMAVEVFGLSYSFPAAMAAVIGFQVNRHQTIYDFALVGSGHGDDS